MRCPTVQSAWPVKSFLYFTGLFHQACFTGQRFSFLFSTFGFGFWFYSQSLLTSAATLISIFRFQFFSFSAFQCLFSAFALTSFNRRFISAFQLSVFQLLSNMAPSERAFAIPKEGQPDQNNQGDQPRPQGCAGVEIKHHQPQHHALQSQLQTGDEGMTPARTNQPLIEMLPVRFIPAFTLQPFLGP